MTDSSASTCLEQVERSQSPLLICATAISLEQAIASLDVGNRKTFRTNAPVIVIFDKGYS
jgi:hypothetical protein